MPIIKVVVALSAFFFLYSCTSTPPITQTNETTNHYYLTPKPQKEEVLIMPMTPTQPIEENTPEMERDYDLDPQPETQADETMNVNGKFIRSRKDSFIDLIESNSPYVVKDSQDLTVFKILGEYVPNGGNLIGSVEHDTVYFALGEEELAGISQEEVDILNCCGVFYERSYDCLSMFV